MQGHSVYTHTLRVRKIESGENPDASAQCNVDIEHTRLERQAAKCTSKSRTDGHSL